MPAVNKIDSNVTGLAYAEEASLGVLPAVPVWNELEPNGYNDFGGTLETIARNPINPSRQRKKGAPVDLDAGGGFTMDITQRNLQDVMQGFMFADFRRKAETVFNEVPVIDATTGPNTFELSNREAKSVDAIATAGSGYAVGDTITLAGGTFSTATVLTVDSVSGGAITAASITTAGRYSVDPTNDVAQGATSGGGTGAEFTMTYGVVISFKVGDLVNGSNFTNAANNGLVEITAINGTETVLTVAETLVAETPPATAGLVVVGFATDSGDLDVDMTGSLPKLTSTALDFTTLGLIPGEWIFLGGDTSGSGGDQFATAENNGFARVRSVAANEMVLDKTANTMVTEANADRLVKVFMGRFLKNELGTLIKRRTYQMERQLGVPNTDNPNAVQSEYLIGSVANELSINMESGSKLEADLSFVSQDNEQRTAAQGLKAGTRKSVTEADLFNTSSDFSRIKLATVEAADAAPTPLFAFAQSLTLSINNGVEGLKALGVFGSFELNTGTFEVSGDLTAYFASIEAVQAVRNNADITLDISMVKDNAGITLDIPLITLGNGQAQVEQDQPITLPLDLAASTAAKIDASLDYTLGVQFWDYLPAAADV